MKIDEMDAQISRWRKRPGKAFLLGCILILGGLVWGYFKTYTNEKAALRASRVKESTLPPFEHTVDGNRITLSGTGKDYSNPVRVFGAGDASAIGEAAKAWLVAHHPGFSFYSAALPIVDDGQTYLVLDVFYGGDTSTFEHIVFDITDSYTPYAAETVAEYQSTLKEILEGVAVGVGGHKGRTMIADHAGFEVFDYRYAHLALQMNSDTNYQSEISKDWVKAIEESESMRKFRDPLTGVSLGRSLGALERYAVHVYDGGLGIGCNFASTNVIFLTIYFYDSDVRGITDGIHSEPVIREFEEVKEGALLRYSDKSRYSRIVTSDSDKLTIGRGDASLDFLRCQFRFEHPAYTNKEDGVVIQAVPGRSTLLLRGVGEAYLKIRATYPEENESICQPELLAALDELAEAIKSRKR